jgi:hypothetical protein
LTRTVEVSAGKPEKRKGADAIQKPESHEGISWDGLDLVDTESRQSHSAFFALKVI